MASKNPNDGQEAQSLEARCASIGEQILTGAGRPPNLLSVQVRELWDGRFRVNIIIGASLESAHIGSSYYVCANAESRVTSTVPSLRHR